MQTEPRRHRRLERFAAAAVILALVGLIGPRLFQREQPPLLPQVAAGEDPQPVRCLQATPEGECVAALFQGDWRGPGLAHAATGPGAASQTWYLEIRTPGASTPGTFRVSLDENGDLNRGSMSFQYLGAEMLASIQDDDENQGADPAAVAFALEILGAGGDEADRPFLYQKAGDFVLAAETLVAQHVFDGCDGQDPCYLAQRVDGTLSSGSLTFDFADPGDGISLDATDAGTYCELAKQNGGNRTFAAVLWDADDADTITLSDGSGSTSDRVAGTCYFVTDPPGAGSGGLLVVSADDTTYPFLTGTNDVDVALVDFGGPLTTFWIDSQHGQTRDCSGFLAVIGNPGGATCDAYVQSVFVQQGAGSSFTYDSGAVSGASLTLGGGLTSPPTLAWVTDHYEISLAWYSFAAADYDDGDPAAPGSNQAVVIPLGGG